MGNLYMLTAPSGKSYIGITTNKTADRWAAHVALAKEGATIALSRAIRKYGEAGFTVKTLVIASNVEYLKDLEKKAIKSFGTKTPNGYNLTDGGDGAAGLSWGEASKRAFSSTASKNAAKSRSKESRAHLAKLHAGKPFGFSAYGTKEKILRSEQTKQEWKDPRIRALRIKNAKGKKRSAESKELMSAVKRGKKWVNDGRCIKLVEPALVPELLLEGWDLGRKIAVKTYARSI